MSAGEHERVQVDVSPSDVVDAQDAGADPTGAGSAGGGHSSRSGAPSASSIREMLSSTSPSESPEAQDGTLSTGARWYQHAELAIKKATGASGTPAWVNGCMAVLLLVAESAGLDLGDTAGAESSTSSSAEPEPDQEAGADAPPVGRQVGQHDNGETSVIGA